MVKLGGSYVVDADGNAERMEFTASAGPISPADQPDGNLIVEVVDLIPAEEPALPADPDIEEHQ